MAPAPKGEIPVARYEFVPPNGSHDIALEPAGGGIEVRVGASALRTGTPKACSTHLATKAAPRVGVAARFAAALRDGDAAELASVSEEFERMGDLVAAVNAAARAAPVYRAARADALAEQCGGVCTLAPRQASEPLPMTDRAREIVMLIGEDCPTAKSPSD